MSSLKPSSWTSEECLNLTNFIEWKEKLCFNVSDFSDAGIAIQLGIRHIVPKPSIHDELFPGFPKYEFLSYQAPIPILPSSTPAPVPPVPLGVHTRSRGRPKIITTQPQISRLTVDISSSNVLAE